MSISSVLSPSTWLSEIASKNTLVAAASFAGGSFASTLMKALQQAGTASAPAATSAVAATAASAAPGGTGAAQGLHHGHHGGGRLAAQLAAAGLATPGSLFSAKA